MLFNLLVLSCRNPFERTNTEQMQTVHEEVDVIRYSLCPGIQHNYRFNNRVGKEMEMEVNQAYGPVSSIQPPPPSASEGAYEL